MEAEILISYPESLALSLKMNDAEFKNEIKTLSIVKLYELGKISSGISAQLLNLSRMDFLELISKYKVSYLQATSDDELESDLNNA
ncbi:UPF0175 family protein [Sphingobacterium hungaricum]|uniref:Uncharacterized protein n=1 Tax=Sphingobacterium hungaricum TaxID=2082723 RepID=A0A928YSR5_9SPHI|nr:UPF0175 family protein [Sphingobacterium hungaricum]MBE8714508.1 hypothetical protein [Sphingobacterium hungaricum]